MKYLKRINESLEDDFEQDIKEILLEVEDYGYTTHIFNNVETYGSDFDYLQILSSEEDVDGKVIIFEDVKDCLLRLKDYLGNRYIRCEIWNMKENGWEKFDLNEDSDPDNDTNSISIDYEK